MENSADTQHPIHDLLQRRWSPRAFAERGVEPEKLLSLLEAARWAPSSRNEQPWHFIVAVREDPSEFNRLLLCLTEGNRQWAQTAPVLLLSVARLYSEHSKRQNRFAFHDVGLAVANLVVQATALGLYAHQMGGFDRERAREAFSIPEGYDPVTAIALGYLDDPEDFPDDLRQREPAPRTRKTLDTFVFAGRWGQTSALVDALSD